MTNVLRTPTDSPEFIQTPAEAGIFLEEFLQSRGRDIQQALYTFESVEAARGVIGTARLCPRLVSESSLDEAKATVGDQGAIWRRETDKVSYDLASLYPSQVITGKYLGAGYFTDERRLCRRQDGSRAPWIFSSFLSQNELDSGTRIATEEMWQDLLIRLLSSAGRAIVQLTIKEDIL